MWQAKTKTKKTLKQHLVELQFRLMVSIAYFVVACIVAYLVREPVLEFIRAPLHQTLYYTTPGGSFSFVFKVSVIVGAIMSTPIWFYNVVQFIEPALPEHVKLTRIKTVVCSHLLFWAGMSFGYYVALPASLQFLGGFAGDQIEALITANEYLNFVLMYVFGFGVLFLLPMFILVINMITPLKPSKMMKHFGVIVLVSFIIAAVLTPTPDPFNQVLMAGPILIMYVLSTVMVAFTNRKRGSSAPVLSNFSDNGMLGAMLSEPDAPEPPMQRQHTQQPHSTVVRKKYVSDIRPTSIKPVRTDLRPARRPLESIFQDTRRKPIIMDIIPTS